MHLHLHLLTVLFLSTTRATSSRMDWQLVQYLAPNCTGKRIVTTGHSAVCATPVQIGADTFNGSATTETWYSSDPWTYFLYSQPDCTGDAWALTRAGMCITMADWESIRIF